MAGALSCNTVDTSQPSPFRATQLWQELIVSFRGGMPRRKKRIKMRSYEDCFTGLEAVEWLHVHMQASDSFGNVSRQQVEKLLQKFLESDVIREVRGKLRRFDEDPAHFYCFVTEPGPLNFVEDAEMMSPQRPTSPLGKRGREQDEQNENEDVQNMSYDGACFTNEYAFIRCDDNEPTTTGATSENKLCSPVKKCRSNSSVKSDRSDSSVDCSQVMSHDPATSGGLAASQVASVWKELTLNRLLLLVELPSLDGVLAYDAVDGKNILGNVSLVFNKLFSSSKATAHNTSSGGRLVSVGGGCGQGISYHNLSSRAHGSSSSSQFARSSESVCDVPRWVILAMRCLSKWPNGCSEELFGGMPIYCGYEFDVLKSLVKYFSTLPDSLVSSKLSELLLSILKLIKEGKPSAVDALQLSTLLLPQTNRMRLHRLLRLINKAGSNKQLRLSKTHSNTHALLEHFSVAVLRPPAAGNRGERSWEEWREDVQRLVGFMAQHYHHIFKVPADVNEEVQKRLIALSSSKGKDTPIKSTRTFCAQVSESEYEEQKKRNSMQCIAALLDSILSDHTMSTKVKKQRLKLFQKQYPDIYAEKCSSFVSVTSSKSASCSSSSVSSSNKRKSSTSSHGRPWYHCSSSPLLTSSASNKLHISPSSSPNTMSLDETIDHS